MAVDSVRLEYVACQGSLSCFCFKFFAPQRGFWKFLIPSKVFKLKLLSSFNFMSFIAKRNFVKLFILTILKLMLRNMNYLKV